MVDEEKRDRFCSSTSSSVFVVILIAQIVIHIIASTLYLLSHQLAPSIFAFCSICVCVLSLFAFVKNNFALIAVYIFLQPIFIAWNVFLLLLYLQVGPLCLPYPPNNEDLTKSEGSGFGEGSGDLGLSDDEDFAGASSLRSEPSSASQGAMWVNYLTLYTSSERSYLLSHQNLQDFILAEENSLLTNSLTVGRLLEIILLLIIIVIASAGFIASIFAHRNIKLVGREKYQSEFRYQSHNRPSGDFQESFMKPRLEPSSRDHLLQNSCDRILQSHHSVSGNHSISSYSHRSKSGYPYHGY